MASDSSLDITVVHTHTSAARSQNKCLRTDVLVMSTWCDAPVWGNCWAVLIYYPLEKQRLPLLFTLLACLLLTSWCGSIQSHHKSSLVGYFVQFCVVILLLLHDCASSLVYFFHYGIFSWFVYSYCHSFGPFHIFICLEIPFLTSHRPEFTKLVDVLKTISQLWKEKTLYVAYKMMFCAHSELQVVNSCWILPSTIWLIF